MTTDLTDYQKQFVQQVGYDPGEWISDWIKDAVKRPTLALPLGVVGPTGTGKSNFVWGILWKCVRQGDCVIIPGDSACEFRHFLLYTKDSKDPKIKLRILIPDEFKFDFFIGKSNDSSDFKSFMEKQGAEVIRYNIYKKSINDFIEPATIVVVMDACFNLESKSWFWQYNLKQIKFRKRYHHTHVTYCFPEASTYFPNTPFREQYKPVYIHSKDFVEFRKFFMRGIYLYHHSSMFFYLLEKQFETVIKKGSSYDSRTPYDNKYGRGKAIHEYTVFHQGHEDIKLKIERKFQEIEEIWKVIPDEEIAFDVKHWEQKEDKSIDEQQLLIDYWDQIQNDNPDWNLEDKVTELLIMFPKAKLFSISALTGISDRKAKKCYYKALRTLKDNKEMNKTKK